MQIRFPYLYVTRLTLLNACLGWNFLNSKDCTHDVATILLIEYTACMCVILYIEVVIDSPLGNDMHVN